jgi:hypothetical protein
MFDNLHSVIDWLLVPISGRTDHYVPTGTAWHGRLMVAAWLILAPLSIIIARFYKVTAKQRWPKVLDNPFWFIWHRRTGYLVGIFMVTALCAIYWSNDFKFRWFGLHAAAGWVLVLIGLLQIIGSLLRGTHGGPIHPITRTAVPPDQWHGDHFSMTRRRVWFEYTHKFSLWILAPVIPVSIFSGLWIADAPRWMWIAIAAVFVLIVAVFIRLQSKGRNIDTYQAIWGLDETLPGNQRTRPIGWAIKRYKANDTGVTRETEQNSEKEK